jgi:hypothetical protein
VDTSSPITRRVYNMALDEFIVWFRLEPRPGSWDDVRLLAKERA